MYVVPSMSVRFTSRLVRSVRLCSVDRFFVASKYLHLTQLECPYSYK